MKSILFISSALVTILKGLKTCEPGSEFVSSDGDTCTLIPDVASKVSIGIKEELLVVTENFEGDVDTQCGALNCKQYLRAWIGHEGSYLHNCSAVDSCIGMILRVGEPEQVPDGFHPDNFTDGNGDGNGNGNGDGNGNGGRSAKVECNAIGSCKNTQMIFNGYFPGGVLITAQAGDSLLNSIVVCDLDNGQECTVLCGDTDCSSLNLMCLGGRCRCIGNSCPLIVFPIGSDPEDPVVLGESPNVANLSCVAGTDDNPPDECRFSPVKRANINGDINCKENFDCCQCELLECGDDDDEPNGKKCSSVNCNGDSGCIGTRIKIRGDAKLGSLLVCDGDSSCQFVKVNAENLVAIVGGGDLSMYGSELILNQNISATTGLNALSIPCNGDESCQKCIIKVKNLGSLICDGDYSCKHTTMELFCVNTLGADKGCVLSCGGDHSCEKSKWDAFNVASFIANGDWAAANTKFVIVLVPAGAPVVCAGDNACQDSIYKLTNVNRLVCSGDEGCKNTRFTVKCVLPLGCPVGVNGDEGALKSIWKLENVASLACSGDEACKKVDFKFSCTSQGADKGCPIVCGGESSCYKSRMMATNVAGLTCVNVNSCSKSIMRLKCADGPKGCPLRCGGVATCTKSDIIIANAGEIAYQGRNVGRNAILDATCSPLNGCSIQCQGVQACQNATMSVVGATSLSIVGARSAQFSKIRAICLDTLDKGCAVLCGSSDSCANVDFDITNSGGLSCVRDSCYGSIFKLKNNKGGSVKCVGNNACRGSIIDSLDNSDTFEFGGNLAFYEGTIKGSCTSTGCPLICAGFGTCQKSDMTLSNIKEVGCSNTNACSEANMHLETNQLGFKGTCGPSSCKNSTIVIKAAVGLRVITGWECSSLMSCQGSTIEFNGGDNEEQVKVESIKCGSVLSCKNTKWILDNAYISQKTYDEACAAPMSCETDDDGIMRLDLTCKQNGLIRPLTDCIRVVS